MSITRTFLIGLIALAAALPMGAQAASLSVTPVAAMEHAQGAGNIALFSFTFDVKAEDGDAYIGTSSSAYQYSVQGPKVDGFVSLLSSAAEKASGAYRITAGKTERFTLLIAAAAGETGQYRARLSKLSYGASASSMTSAHEFSRFETRSLYREVSGTNEVSGAVTTASATSVAGTAKGTDSVSVTIRTAGGARVYVASGIEVESGKWSHMIDTDLSSGSYTVTANDAVSGKELSKKTLTIK